MTIRLRDRSIFWLQCRLYTIGSDVQEDMKRSPGGQRNLFLESTKRNCTHLPLFTDMSSQGLSAAKPVGGGMGGGGGGGGESIGGVGGWWGGGGGGRKSGIIGFSGASAKCIRGQWRLAMRQINLLGRGSSLSTCVNADTARVDVSLTWQNKCNVGREVRERGVGGGGRDGGGGGLGRGGGGGRDSTHTSCRQQTTDYW